MLFSATQTKKIQELARLSLKTAPVFVDVTEKSASSTVNTLEQGYVSVASHLRFLLLFTFLKKNMKKKVIVFLSSCNAVQFYGELLNYIDVPVLFLHVYISISDSLTVILGKTKTKQANFDLF
jgi:ATP-dependent RNA helicase DDX18/HAS1